MNAVVQIYSVSLGSLTRRFSNEYEIEYIYCQQIDDSFIELVTRCQD